MFGRGRPSLSRTVERVSPSPQREIFEVVRSESIQSSAVIRTRQSVPERVPAYRTRPIKLASTIIGSSAVVWIAGPRYVKSAEQMVAVGLALQQLGLRFIRAKAVGNRDSEGRPTVIDRQGLRLLRAAANRFELGVVSEVFASSDVSFASEHCDVIEIGPQNMSNTRLLREVAASGRPVIAHRSPLMPVEEFLTSIALLERGRTPLLLLADNGLYSGDERNDTGLDLSAIVALRRATSHPVLVNCSALSRDWTYTESAVSAAVAAGADGVIVDMMCRFSAVESRGVKEVLPIELDKMVKRVTAMKVTLNALLRYEAESAFVPSLAAPRVTERDSAVHKM
jgi:3-deoxy-7-phosphoheptulonate synthase